MFGKKNEKQENELETGTKRRSSDISFHLMDKLKELGLSKLVGILAAGILILLFLSEFMGGTSDKSLVATKSESVSNENNKNSDELEEYKRRVENTLEQKLSKVKGVGKVEVMVNVTSSKERVPLKDENSQEETTEEQDSAGGSRKSSSKNRKSETVYTQYESGVSSPYELKVLEPPIEGVVVIAKGGDNEVVKSNLISAIEALYNVPAHKIVVLKREDNQ